MSTGVYTILRSNLLAFSSMQHRVDMTFAQIEGNHCLFVSICYVFFICI